MSESSPTPPYPAGYAEWCARRTVQEAAAAARLLGVVFAALGGILLVPMLQGRYRRGSEVWGFVNVVILVGPGVWYFLAASWIRRLDRRAATVSLRVAAVQFSAVALGMILRELSPRGGPGDLTMPALLALFFMPALAALVYHLVRARAAMNLVESEGSAFEPIVRPVLPLDPGMPLVPATAHEVNAPRAADAPGGPPSQPPENEPGAKLV